MKLYEVNRQIEELLGRLEPDPETGEIPADEEEIIARINELAIAREDILTYLAKLFLNGKAMLQSVRAEEVRLKDRSQKMARKQDRLLSILDRECVFRNSCVFIQSRIVFNRNTFSNVSLVKC